MAQILALWQRAKARGERVCLATVVRVEGSSYRKPGARMLLTAGGERAGTVSGGCLEAEIMRKAWWLTASGPVVEQYSSSLEEDGAGWGLGCGGTVSILLEQEPLDVLHAIAAATSDGEPSVIVSPARSGANPGANLDANLGAKVVWRRRALSDGMGDELPDHLQAALEQCRRERRSLSFDEENDGAWLVEYLAPPPRLTVFGGGDDARPIAEFALALGWRVTVADGRSQLLRPERFPFGTVLRTLVYAPADDGPLRAVDPGVRPGEMAVILTHSYEQDRNLLAALLPHDLLYLGILGPRHRTARLLEELATSIGLTVEQCFARLHAPVGLDLGARDPAAIALSIVAELQATLAGRHVTVSPIGGPIEGQRTPAPQLLASHA